MPGHKCTYCNVNDWTRYENKWKCTGCGMEEVKLIEDINEWIESCLMAYDEALGSLEYSKSLPNNGQAEQIVYLARIKRAERQLITANIKAEVASTIQTLKNVNTKGEIYLNLPDIELNIKLKW